MKSYKEFLAESSQYDILAQFRYYIADKLGEDEYQKLQDAGPIAGQDGDISINITTSDKPEGTHPDSLTKVQRGWLSTYKKYDGLKEGVREKTELVKNFAQSLMSKYPIKNIKLFYYPESPTEDVVTINVIEVAEKNTGIGTMIMNDITNFADNNSFILTLDPSDKFGSTISRLKEFYKRFGFVDNKYKKFTEKMIRFNN